jgi:hypothetical protein
MDRRPSRRRCNFAESFAEQMTFHPFANEACDYGVGITRGDGIIGYSGETPGSKTEMCFLPDSGIRVVIIAAGGDDDFSPRAYMGELIDALLEWRD